MGAPTGAVNYHQVCISQNKSLSVTLGLKSRRTSDSSGTFSLFCASVINSMSCTRVQHNTSGVLINVSMLH